MGSALPICFHHFPISAIRANDSLSPSVILRVLRVSVVNNSHAGEATDCINSCSTCVVRRVSPVWRYARLTTR